MVNRNAKVVNVARRIGTGVNPAARGLIGHGCGGFRAVVQRPGGGVGHRPHQGVAGVGPVLGETRGAGDATSLHRPHAGGQGNRWAGTAGVRVGAAGPPLAPVGPGGRDCIQQGVCRPRPDSAERVTVRGSVGTFVPLDGDVHHDGLFRGQAGAMVWGVLAGLLILISGIWWFRPAERPSLRDCVRVGAGQGAASAGYEASRLARHDLTASNPAAEDGGEGRDNSDGSTAVPAAGAK